MNRTSELNPTRMVSITLIVIAVVGVIAVGSMGESDSQNLSAGIVEAPSEVEPPPADTVVEPVPEQNAQDFDSWASEADSGEQPQDESEAESAGTDGGDGDSGDQPAPETPPE